MKDSNNNSGDFNSGNCNSGNYNSGHRNSGHYNSGHRNSGDYNSGNCNSGHRNSGHYNSGHRNSGDYNSGNYNSGYSNSGNCNSGYSNSGNYNSGDYNSGYFNTDEPTVRMFNKDTGLKISETPIPYINLPITEWIPEGKMTLEQKKNDPNFHIKQGTLIKRTYKEAWTVAWNALDQAVKDKFLNLPNFNTDIFEEITGIKINTELHNDDKIIEVNGKKYKLVE